MSKIHGITNPALMPMGMQVGLQTIGMPQPTGVAFANSGDEFVGGKPPAAPTTKGAATSVTARVHKRLTNDTDCKEQTAWEVCSELVEVLKRGDFNRAKVLVYLYAEKEDLPRDSLPILDSRFFDLAQVYIERVSQQTLFGATLILGDILQYDCFVDENGNLSATAFQEQEEKYSDELEEFPFQSLYAKWMSKGALEIVEVDGIPMLKIYRGLRVPKKDTISEGDDRLRRAGAIDLTNPGVDWSPIRAFTKSYGSEAVFSALVPLDDPEILRQSIDNSTLDDDWRGRYDAPLEKLTDCLIVVVPESRYHLLRDLKIEYTDATFETK